MSTMAVEGAGPRVEGAAADGVAPQVDYLARNEELFGRRVEVAAALEAVSGPGSRARVTRRRLQRELSAIDAELVRLNAPLVYSYVNRFRSKSSAELTAEYEAAGMLGLYSAISTFVPGKGRFSSWAHLRIKREVTRAVHANEFANMNYGDFEARPRILAAVEAAGGVALADLDEVAAEAGVTRASVDAVVGAPRLSSMDAAARSSDEGSDAVLADVVTDDDGDPVDEMFLASSVSALEKLVLPLLTARELLVLVRRFGLDGQDPTSSAEVGRLLGVSREAARQLESRTMAKLNHPIALRKLRRHR